MRDRLRNTTGIGEDTGITLLELLVTLTIMSVVGATVTAGMVQMYRSTRHTETLTTLTQQAHLAFQRLDREVRYATAIGSPSAVPSGTGHRYVEYAAGTGGTVRCTQLRLGNGALQRRVRVGSAPTGAWSTLATGIADGGRFSVLNASPDGYQHQRLTVVITISVRPVSNSSTRTAEFTFTALNTSVGAPTDVCTGMARP